MPNAQEGMLCDEEAGAEGSGGHNSCGATVHQVSYAWPHSQEPWERWDWSGVGGSPLYRELNLNREVSWLAQDHIACEGHWWNLNTYLHLIQSLHMRRLVLHQQQSRVSYTGQRGVTWRAEIEESVTRNLCRPWSFQESLLQVQKPKSNWTKQHEDLFAQDLEVLNIRETSELVGFSG